MVNEESVGGLKSALERGQTLQKAMMTLYNSGYKKEEIEEAARGLLQFKPEAQLQPAIKTTPKSPVTSQIPQVLTPPQIPPTPIIAPLQPSFQPPTPLAEVSQQPLVQKPKKSFFNLFSKKQVKENMQVPVQKISSYEAEKPKNGKRIIVIILVILLVFLIGILGIIFLFKQQLIDYLSNLFG